MKKLFAAFFLFTAMGTFAQTPNVQSFNLISNMIATTAATNTACFVKGYHTINDGGGGHFYYDSTKSTQNDAGTIFNGWVRIIGDHITPEMWGAWHDGIHDDAIAINNASLYAFSRRTFFVNTQSYRQIPAIDFYSTTGTYYIKTTVELLAGVKYNFNNATFKATASMEFMVATPPSASTASDLLTAPWYNYSSGQVYGQTNIYISNLVIDGNGLAENGLVIETAPQGTAEKIKIYNVTAKHWADGADIITANSAFNSNALSVNRNDNVYRNANFMIYRPSQSRYLKGVYQIDSIRTGNIVVLTATLCENAVTGDQIIQLPTGYIMNSNQFTSNEVSSSFNGLGIMAGNNYRKAIFDDSRFYSCFANDNSVGYAANSRQRDRIYAPTFQHNNYWNLVIIDGGQYLIDGWYPEVGLGNAMVNNENYGMAYINSDGADIDIQIPIHYAGSGGWYRFFEVDGRWININMQADGENFGSPILYVSGHAENAIVKLDEKKFPSPSITLNLNGTSTYSRIRNLRGAVIDSNYVAYGPAIINGKETFNTNIPGQQITHALLNYDQGSMVNFSDTVLTDRNNPLPKVSINSSGLFFGDGGKTAPTTLSAHADQVSQTANLTLTSVQNGTATSSAIGTYNVGGYLNTASTGSFSITLQVRYTDEFGRPITIQLGTVTSSVSPNYTPVTIRVLGNTAIILECIVTSGTPTFDAGGYINRVYN